MSKFTIPHFGERERESSLEIYPMDRERWERRRAGDGLLAEYVEQKVSSCPSDSCKVTSSFSMGSSHSSLSEASDLVSSGSTDGCGGESADRWMTIVLSSSTILSK